MKTVGEFIEDCKLKEGDCVSDGIDTWEVTRTQNWDNKYVYYLRNLDHSNGHVADRLVDRIAIKDLKVVPKRIHVFQYAYEVEGLNRVEISSYFYSSKEDFKRDMKANGIKVIGASQIDFTIKEVEEDRRKLKYF